MVSLLHRVVKPKTKRGKRFLENRESKVIENTKQSIFVKGGRTNELVSETLKQFYTLKRPHSMMLSKKNILRPFDDAKPLEYLSEKNDSSLFMFGCSSKKRPNSLIMGRTFDNEVIDMFEFEIEAAKMMDQFKEAKITVGTKPCLIFNGEPFDIDPDFIRLKCLLTDFFKGETPDNIRLQGIEHVLNFTAVDGKVIIRSYKIKLDNSTNKIPNVNLTEIGPSFDLSVRRTKLGSDDLYKKSLKQPKEMTPKKKKNISRDAFGSVLGRIHMQKQDLNKLQTRKLNAFKKNRMPEATESSDKPAKKVKKAE